MGKKPKGIKPSSQIPTEYNPEVIKIYNGSLFIEGMSQRQWRRDRTYQDCISNSVVKAGAFYYIGCLRFLVMLNNISVF